MISCRDLALAEVISLPRVVTWRHHFAESKASDAESETVAEAVAYVVCSHFGLDTGVRSFPYIAVWSEDKAVLKNASNTVQRLSAKMIHGVEGNKGGEEVNSFG